MKEARKAEFKIEDQQEAATVKYLLILETDKPSLKVILKHLYVPGRCEM